ncbi:MAG: hypothetical protein IPO32_13120 [Crocinitomicaceae bacterium]|jgi:hypothetical protein|nr:hypothetical protein [Crocinitomicaceae bacterium]MBK9592383.1 hypothetical protein [Crocinitomicaceae bacterium]
MLKATFYVPLTIMPGFAIGLGDCYLYHSIKGASQNNEIIVEVKYKEEESCHVEWLQRLYANLLNPKATEYRNN